MANPYSKSTDADLLGQARVALSLVAPDPQHFNTTPEMVTRLAALCEVFAERTFEAAEAKARYHGAVAGRRDARQELLSTFGQLVNQILGSEELTEAEVREAGLNPRERRGSRIRPLRPEELQAQPNANGTVLLHWKPGGNPYRVTYLVEVSAEGREDWKVLLTTTKTRVRVRGFAPGVERWFRVSAAHSEQTSASSNTSVIYPPTVAREQAA
jgi:hypothetical protein